MMSRRSFCRNAAMTAVAADLISGAARASALAGDPAIAAVLHDERLMQSRAFSDRLAARGIPAFGFRGDPSRLWLDGLAALMRKGAAPFAGLTGQGALFCLERWSWDMGMRVVARIDHAEAGATGWRHCPAAPELCDGLEALATAGPAFGAAAADILLSQGITAGTDLSHAAPPRVADRTGEQLVSWVIAPARRA